MSIPTAYRTLDVRKRLRIFLEPKCRLLADRLLSRVPTRRKDYLDWLSSSEGPRRLYFLKRFKPSLPVLYGLRLRHAFSARRPACRGSRYLFVPPSPRVKARALRRHARQFGLSIFVETGTYHGDTVAAIAEQFDQCFTVELSPELWQSAALRLAPQKNVLCLHGDSSAVLPEILRQIGAPALFWLDAHASGGDTIDTGRNPLLDELAAIYAHNIKRHVILIDDARGQQVTTVTAAVPPTYRAIVRNDIIRITPAHD